MTTVVELGPAEVLIHLANSIDGRPTLDQIDDMLALLTSVEGHDERIAHLNDGLLDIRNLLTNQTACDSL